MVTDRQIDRQNYCRIYYITTDTTSMKRAYLNTTLSTRLYNRNCAIAGVLYIYYISNRTFTGGHKPYTFSCHGWKRSASANPWSNSVHIASGRPTLRLPICGLQSRTFALFIRTRKTKKTKV